MRRFARWVVGTATRRSRRGASSIRLRHRAGHLGLDLMDVGSNDCAAATSVVQTIPPMNQSGSSARFMRADYSHREFGVVRLVWLVSVGGVQLHPEGTAEPGASEAEARANSQKLRIGPVR